MGHDQLPYVDSKALTSWVAEQTGLSLEVVAAVLQIKFEFMVGVGLISSDPPGADYEFIYYAPDDLDHLRGTRHVDTDRIARDAERLLGVTFETADQVLNSELGYLELRGIA